MGKFLWLVFVLILLFLLLSPRSGTKEVINALSKFGTQSILALQGRFTEG